VKVGALQPIEQRHHRVGRRREPIQVLGVSRQTRRRLARARRLVARPVVASAPPLARHHAISFFLWMLKGRREPEKSMSRRSAHESALGLLARCEGLGAAMERYAAGLPVVRTIRLQSPPGATSARVELFSEPAKPVWIESGVPVVGWRTRVGPSGVAWEGRLTCAPGGRPLTGVLAERAAAMLDCSTMVAWADGAYVCMSCTGGHLVETRLFPSDELHAALPWLQKFQPPCVEWTGCCALM